MRMRSSVRSGVPTLGAPVCKLAAEREMGGFVAGLHASRRLNTVKRKLVLHYDRGRATHRSDRSNDMADDSILIVSRWQVADREDRSHATIFRSIRRSWGISPRSWLT